MKIVRVSALCCVALVVACESSSAPDVVADRVTQDQSAVMDMGVDVAAADDAANEVGDSSVQSDASPALDASIDATAGDASADSAPGADAAAIDAAREASVDARTDGGAADSGADARADGAADSGVDARADGAADSGADASVTFPNRCTSAAQCGSTAQCVNNTCVCPNGTIACATGCCLAAWTNVTRPNVAGIGVELAHSPDGTAWILTRAEAGATRLYRRAPGGAIEDTALGFMSCDLDSDAMDIAVRDDGTVFIVSVGSCAESTPVTLYELAPGAASFRTTALGSAFGVSPGVGMNIDARGTVWISYAAARSGGMRAIAIARAGVRRDFSLGTSGTVQRSDVEIDPTTGVAYSFYNHRYTGSLSGETLALDSMLRYTGRCAVSDDAAFDAMGRTTAVATSYPDFLFTACAYGENATMNLPSGLPALDSRSPLLQPIVFIGDRQQTPFIAGYEWSSYTAFWFAARAPNAWSGGALYRFGPMVGGGPSRVYTAGSGTPAGRPAIALLPRTAAQGPLVYLELR